MTEAERRALRRAIDRQRRNVLTAAGQLGQGGPEGWVDWCIDDADGDPLIALDIAVTKMRPLMLQRQAARQASSG